MENFLNSLCSQIQCKEVHEEIKNEVLNHIKEMQGDYMTEGFSEEEAINKAIANMGDSESIGFDLNKIYKKTPDWKLLILVSIMIISGVIINYFTTMNTRNYMYDTKKFIIYLLLGMPIMYFVYKFDYRKIEKHSVTLFIATTLLIFITTFTGASIYRRAGLFIFSRYMDIMYISSIAYILSLGGILKNINWSSKRYIIKASIVLLLPNILFIWTSCTFYSLTYTLCFLIISYYNGASYKKLCLFLGEMALIVFYILTNNSYIIHRFIGIYSYNDFMSSSIKNLLSSSSLVGHGTSETLNALPSLNSELIILYVIYTFGWITALALITLIILFVIRIFKIFYLVKNNYGKSMILNINAFYLIQILWFIMMNFSILPITGIVLPFINFGGSYFIINMVMVGLIFSIYSRRNFSNNTPIEKISPTRYFINADILNNDIVKNIIEFLK
ncbi:FtsW/RodA/SpoVE family cell cycle protein [Desnuesiella massiliensis]|uniref:FtsW/RodA/SpoVE family cell cycle protein n=1 Tax=Desnuesiella massiliensis TaxID=1650662 RepID=UPI00311A80A5